ncbi:hypothetical protein [Plesiomonas shigelloides]|uniref:hypothetical protein n=1 Tax=Plesiomonas shigelloides TaxID=703 RepID=UPI0012629651|nr:hypothetical protein [Plesiomonas shigelloides]
MYSDMTTHFDFPELRLHLGLPDDFFRKLADEDDWSFVIKLHALFEGVCSHLLTYHFREQKLEKIFSRLELSNKSTGKIAILSELGLLQDSHKKLLYKLSEIRNSLVHDIRNSEFDLIAMVGEMDKSQIKQFAITFSPYETLIRSAPFDGFIGFNEKQQELATIEHVINRAKKSPKHHIFYGAYDVLISLIDMYSYSDYLNDSK